MRWWHFCRRRTPPKRPGRHERSQAKRTSACSHHILRIFFKTARTHAWVIGPVTAIRSRVLTRHIHRQYSDRMPDRAGRKRSSPREQRVSRTYRLPLSKLRAAKRALGAATATEAIERALDLAVFQRELVDGTRAMLGVEIASPDPER
jgi:hypothetical protein